MVVNGGYGKFVDIFFLESWDMLGQLPLQSVIGKVLYMVDGKLWESYGTVKNLYWKIDLKSSKRPWRGLTLQSCHFR